MVAVVVATVLSGCSPAASRQLAIRVVNGAVEFVFAPCPNERVHDVLIKEENESNFRVWQASGGPDAPVMSSIQLFHTPQGWITGSNTLSSLEPGKSYQGILYSGATRTSELGSITTAAIEALDDGRVLGPGESSYKATPMSMSDFQRTAVTDCGD
jgi:hypothetical protein